MGSLSDAQSDWDSDISESEMDDHEKKCYMELKKGKHQVLVKTNGFTCPYCQSLIIKERKSNEDVQEARKELISALKNLASDSGRTTIGVRRMGELDTEPRIEAMKLKCDHEEAEDRASELCSLWDEHLRDANWHSLEEC